MRVLWYWPHPHRVLSPAAESLIDAGDAVTIQCLDTFRGQVDDDPRVRFRRELPEVGRYRRLPDPLRRVVRIATYVRRAVMRERLVRSEKFDVCHIGTLNYLVDAFALPRLRRFVPVVAFVHDVVPHEARLPAGLERRLLQRVYRSADVYVVLHEVVGQGLISQFGVDPSRVVFAEHPLTPADDGRDLPDGAGPSRSDRGGATEFLFFGTFRTDKGIPVLLDAARLLVGDPGSHIHIAGGGDRGLERAVASAAERGEVSSELGRVSPARKDELFRSADVVVLPYDDPVRFQSQSGVLADAYAYRKPVIVGDVGAIGSTVRADGTGWVVSPGDSEALADRIRSVAGDPEGCRAAASAIEAALPKYSYREYGRTLRRAYEFAIRLRSKASGLAFP